MSMKLATFEVETAVGRSRRVGVKRDDRLVDVTTAYAAALEDEGEDDPLAVAEAHAPADTQRFLRRGDRALEAAREALAHTEEVGEDGRGPTGGRFVFDPDDDEDVRLLPPLPCPNTLRDFMVFEEHVRNTGGDPPDVWYDVPIYYKGNPNPDVTYGPGDQVPWPDYSEQIDYELEVAAVVGKGGRDIPAEEADNHIAGYTVFNDFSARDTQLEEMQGRLGPAKGKDFANAFGPYLVTQDEFEVTEARMTAEVNGETWSEGVVGEMHHSFADIVEHVSQDETLYPGDVLGSGTVGEGCGLELGRFLEKGDTVTLSVEGIGALENTVV